MRRGKFNFAEVFCKDKRAGKAVGKKGSQRGSVFLLLLLFLFFKDGRH